MNRTKIEEKLQEAEKEYSSVKFLSDSKSFMKMKIAQAKIQLLTSLLAEDKGEVVMSFNQLQDAILNTAEVIHDYMRNGDRSTSREECITWIAQLIQEASQQAPSATVDLPAIKTLFAKWCNAKTEDTHSNAMTLNAFAVAVTELLHSQQPTVRVDALWEKHSTESREDEGENGIMYKNEFATALTEALRGSYSKIGDNK